MEKLTATSAWSAEDQLGLRFRAAVTAWEEERQRLNAMIAQLEQLAGDNASKVDPATLDVPLQKLEGKVDIGKAPDSGAVNADLSREIAKIDAQIVETKAFVEDPQTDLPIAIRKHVENRELRAYRRGLSFLIAAEEKKGFAPPTRIRRDTLGAKHNM